MPTPRDRSKKEHPSTYVVQGGNREELQRLTIQDALMTTIMGGPLAEQDGAATMRNVLDIGSGSGNWVLTAARMYPEMKPVGIDISQHMVDYARHRAAEQGLSERVTFRVMDALIGLDFPAAAFDLVNLRFGISFIRTWEWPQVLQEMHRVCRPGGVIRVTECEVGGHSSSPAVMQLHAMSVCALYRSGHLFEQTLTGLIDHLEGLLTRHGCRQVQTRRLPVELQPGTKELQDSIRDVTYLYRTTRPFLEKWGCAPADYDAIYQQALQEMQDPNFSGGVTLLTAWGSKPEML
jgi:ubiquinone/menaquinone biosynthesis C-methylase UbiE